MSSAERIRHNLVLIMREKEISWGELVRRTGLTKRAILNFRHGSDIRTATMDKLAAAVNVATSTLLKPIK